MIIIIGLHFSEQVKFSKLRSAVT